MITFPNYFHTFVSSLHRNYQRNERQTSHIYLVGVRGQRVGEVGRERHPAKQYPDKHHYLTLQSEDYKTIKSSVIVLLCS